MNRRWFVAAMIAIFVFSVPVHAQAGPSGAQQGCAVELSNLHVDSLSVRLKNTSGKKIVGLVFNVAFADATERWRWLHWEYDLNRPMQEFGWNKPIGQGESKKLQWGFDFDHEHGGGVALALTSILYADGTSWEDAPDSTSCMQIWYHRHKKGFTKPVFLPLRDQARL
ncbi:MAG TPA: hypothetical protein VIB39_03565 [Candidatus Angelobacter sp.]|jgi:hypothetical protein